MPIFNKVWVVIYRWKGLEPSFSNKGAPMLCTCIGKFTVNSCTRWFPGTIDHTQIFPLLICQQLHRAIVWRGKSLNCYTTSWDPLGAGISSNPWSNIDVFRQSSWSVPRRYRSVWWMVSIISSHECRHQRICSVQVSHVLSFKNGLNRSLLPL